MNDPAVLFYTSDFLTGVIDMTMEERGQYITLLCYQHQKGHMKEETIRLLVGSVSDNVLSHFIKDENGLYYNGRMDSEKSKRANFTESRRANGLKGGRPKKKKSPEEMTDWEEMLQFFDNKCIKCGYQFKDGDKPTKDHIIPKSWGGDDDISNLQPLCRQCNSSKCADHCEDYRLNYISDIPQRLKEKWFKKTYEKPLGFENKNLMGNENENENINDNINEIINYLNIKTNSNYKSNSKNTKSHISARLKEGYTIEDFKKVIDIKYSDWYNTDYEKFLRPDTLFGTKFESYLNQKSKRKTLKDISLREIEEM